MDQWSHFLRECVYYPCSHLHGTPVKLLSSRFSRFFYTDYSVTREDFQKELASGAFKGYRLAEQRELDPTEVFGVPWNDLRREHTDTYSRLHFDSSNPFTVLCIFQRESGLTDEHGPDSFQLMFARVEAIAALESAFSRRSISPKCLVHIRSGIGFGGNFSDYPRLLEQSLRGNRGGLPRFILHDSMAVGHGGDHLQLIGDYRNLQTWGYPDGGYLKLVERNDVQPMPLPFVDHVGARIVESSEGSSLLSLVIQPIHFNSSGIVHGAVPFTLADTGMGVALFSLLSPTEGCATIEIKINYFRPVLEGELSCRSVLVHKGRTTATLESVLSVRNLTVAKATGTFAIFPRKSSAA